MSTHAIDDVDTYHVMNEPPTKMKENEPTPRKKLKGKKPKKSAIKRSNVRSNTKTFKKDRKFPPEVKLPPTNMSIDDFSDPEYESSGDRARDKSLERAQENATSGDEKYKIPEVEKEGGQIQAPEDADTKLYSKEEFIQFKLDDMDKFLEAKAKQHICAFYQEFEQKPNMEDAMHVQIKYELLGEDWLDNYATEILDAKYNKTNVNNVVQQQNHLTASQPSGIVHQTFQALQW